MPMHTFATTDNTDVTDEERAADVENYPCYLCYPWLNAFLSGSDAPFRSIGPGPWTAPIMHPA